MRTAGFTLVELLVVMVMAGILAAIAIPAVAGQRRRAVDGDMKSDLRAVAARMETYFADLNSYPTTITISGNNAVLPGGYTTRLSAGTTMSVTTPARANSILTYCLVASRKSGASPGTRTGCGSTTRAACRAAGW